MYRRLLALVIFGYTVGCGSLTELSLWPAPDPGIAMETREQKRAAFSQALDAFRHHEDARAMPVFRALVSAYPELADHHLYYAGASAARLQRDREASALLRRVVDEFPASVHSTEAELQLGRVELRRGNLDAARAHLYRCANIAGDKETARSARLEIAQAELKAGNTDTAYRGFAEIREEAPGSGSGRAAKDRIMAMRAAHPELMPAGSDRQAELRLLLAERDYAAAERLAEDLRANPGNVDPAVISRSLAEAEYGAGKLEPALKTLWKTAEQYPQSPEAASALARIGTILWNRDRDEAARRVFADFLNRYPAHEKAPEAQYAMARIDQKAGRSDAAIEAYEHLASRYPESNLAPEARWRIGWIHYRNDRFSAAAAAFAEASASGASATYWQARALERAGSERRARELYASVVANEPDSYYGLWAKRRLEHKGASLRLEARAPEAAPPLILDRGSFDDPFHRSRADELRAAGQLTLARRELAAIEQAHSDDPAALRFLVATYPGVDGQAAAARLAKKLDDATLSAGDRDRLLYPLAFWNTVRRNAEPLLVDPLLVVAVMRQESFFDPEARSSADARGLLQLLPSTAERLAPSVTPRIDASDLYDPDVNIALGVRYLHDLEQRFGGDPIKVVAAYNGGESAVGKWTEQARNLDPDELVETISYRETRDYVKRVLGNYNKYARLYGS